MVSKLLEHNLIILWSIHDYFSRMILLKTYHSISLDTPTRGQVQENKLNTHTYAVSHVTMHMVDRSIVTIMLLVSARTKMVQKSANTLGKEVDACTVHKGVVLHINCIFHVIQHAPAYTINPLYTI